MLVDSLFVTLGLDASGFEKGQNQTAVALKKLSEQSDKTAKGFETSGKVMATAFDTAAESALGFFAILAGGKSLESLMNVAKTDAAVGKLAKNLDMLPGRVKTFQNAAVAAGSTADAMKGALGGLSSGMEDMDRGGSTPLQGILNQLHLGYKKANGGDVESGDLFLAISDKLSKMDPRDAAYLGNALGFDPSITSMAELGAPAINQLLAANQSNLTQKTVDESNALIKSFGNLDTVVDNISNDLLDAFSGTLIKEIDDFAKGLWVVDQVMTGKMSWSTFGKLLEQGIDSGWNSQPHPQRNDPNYKPPPATSLSDLLHPPTAAQIALRNQGLAYFQSQGYTANQAAGIMANVNAESGFNPNAVSADGGAHGLFQWRGARWAALVAKYGPNPTAAQQFQFAQDELNSSEGAAKAGLLGTTSAFGAGVMFDKGFERSGDNIAQQYARGAAATAISLTRPGGVPYSAQSASAAALRNTTSAFGAGVVLDNSDQRSGDNIAQQYARGAAATAISLTRPGGVPYSAQSALNNLRAAQSVTVHNNIKIDAKGGDPKRIARELRKTTATTITAARANTGLD